MEKVVTRDREILGGEPVFAVTRVPISRPIFEQLAACHSRETPVLNKLGVFDKPSLTSRTIAGDLLNASARIVRKTNYF